ncbi:SART-1 protein [Syncephalis fuscata]|nr:SART-1 protein [Syncephalis fuscata]
MADDNNSNADEISLSLEETNKLRISLGLKPLEAGPSNATVTAERNYREQRDKEKKAAEEKAIKNKIEKLQNRAKLSKKLEGKGLGEADVQSGEVSAVDWLEEQDEIAANGQSDYSAGLKVAHDLSEFQEGEEQVLVLKDSTIMEMKEGDQLESIHLAEKSRLERNLENRKKRPIYTGYDDEEFSTTIGNKPTILSHYDDVIDGTVTDRLRAEGETLDIQVKEADVTFRKSRQSRRGESTSTTTSTSTTEQAIPDELAMALDALALAPEEIAEQEASDNEDESCQSYNGNNELVFSDTTGLYVGLPLIGQREPTDIGMTDFNTANAMEIDSAIVKNEDGEEEKEDEELDPERAAESDEPLVATGLGATMALLRQKELRNARMAHNKLNLSKNAKHMPVWIGKRSRETLRREAAAQSGKRGGHALERERELDLVYMDKHGHRLNQKEFHGKQSGKAKTEKRMKQMAEQQRLDAMPSNDTPLGSAAALQVRQQRTGMAHMVLQLGDTRYSGRIGSRSHAPDALSVMYFNKYY